LNTLTKSSTGVSNIRGMVYASMFGAATAAGAYIIIPVPPVPVTMQTLFLSLAGVLIGARLAAMSQIIYVIIGAMGLPVFAGGKAGLGILIGPTGGYLLGFVAGAYVIGKLAELRPSAGMMWFVSSMAAGTFVIYLFGAAQLSVVAQLSLSKAAAVGVLPFIPGDAVKILLAAFVCRKLRPHLDIRGSG
jgi:biotin transport system substrate-specific component